jgi:hypothetical protein
MFDKKALSMTVVVVLLLTGFIAAIVINSDPGFRPGMNATATARVQVTQTAEAQAKATSVVRNDLVVKAVEKTAYAFLIQYVIEQVREAIEVSIHNSFNK